MAQRAKLKGMEHSAERIVYEGIPIDECQSELVEDYPSTGQGDIPSNRLTI